MLQRITPALKGLITGLLMIAVALIIEKTNQQDPRLQYIVYAIYGAGIVWTIQAYLNSISHSPKFSELFSQGFRCFVIVTMVMVAFTFIYIKTHPELIEREAAYQREEMIKQKDKTPEQIDAIIASGKKGYPIANTSVAIFRYLIIGSVLTAACSGIIILRSTN